MKRLLLASAAAVAITAASVHSASAQFVVECPTCAKEFTQLFSWARALINETKQIALATQQLQQLSTTYSALTGVRDIGSALSAMGALGIQNPLPIDPYALQNLINGTGGAQGMVNSLAMLYTGNRSANNVYTPSGNDWQSQQMIANANSLASIQAVVQRAFQAAGDRLAQLSALRARLATASDPKEIWDLQAQIAVAQSDAQAQGLQAQQVQTLAMIQPHVFEQQREEYTQQAICKYIAYLRENENGVAPPPNCGSVSPAIAMASPNLSAGATASAGGSNPLNLMLAQSWGATAASYAQQLGVNPTALAATCQLESGCQNVSGTGSITGAFQMTSSTYQAAIQEASASGLPINTSLRGQSDPANQSIAAAQYLKDGALSLQSQDIASPSVLDVRSYYQFGSAYGAAVATAQDSELMSTVLGGYSASALQANGITPGVTTVGQWRQSVANKIGAAAYQPVLLTST